MITVISLITIVLLMFGLALFERWLPAPMRHANSRIPVVIALIGLVMGAMLFSLTVLFVEDRMTTITKKCYPEQVESLGDTLRSSEAVVHGTYTLNDKVAAIHEYQEARRELGHCVEAYEFLSSDKPYRYDVLNFFGNDYIDFRNTRIEELNEEHGVNFHESNDRATELLDEYTWNKEYNIGPANPYQKADQS